MSTTRFDPTSSDGFVQNIDPDSARRQFNLSLSLVAVLAISTLTAALTLRIEPVAPTSTQTRMVVQAPQLVHVQQAAQDTKRQPGG